MSGRLRRCLHYGMLAAFAGVPQKVRELRPRCTSPGCRRPSTPLQLSEEDFLDLVSLSEQPGKNPAYRGDGPATSKIKNCCRGRKSCCAASLYPALLISDLNFSSGKRTSFGGPS